jgi:hypothetical protein
MMEDAKLKFHNVFFMETFLIGTWLIWMQRHAFIFNRGLPSHSSWKVGFLEEAQLQLVRMLDVNKNVFFEVFTVFSLDLVFLALVCHLLSFYFSSLYIYNKIAQ